MPLLNRRSFQKKEPWRDATIFIIVCEGSQKEPNYFDFFDRLTSKIKVETVPSEEGKSSPNHLIANAERSMGVYNSDQGDYELWFIVDIDNWLDHKHLYDLFNSCKEVKNWNMAISNPCFEVWLVAHFGKESQPTSEVETCKSWKKHLQKVSGGGGFHPINHPILLPRAIENSKRIYQEDGFIPHVGCTQVYRVGERILDLTDGVLDR